MSKIINLFKWDWKDLVRVLLGSLFFCIAINFFVVPNHLLGQWANEILKLYPTANILVATQKDFEKTRRKKLMAKIATGEWDAVLIAHSSFGLVPMSREYEKRQKM